MTICDHKKQVGMGSGGRLQIANNLTALGGVMTGLCVECALRHHDFREVLGRGADEGLFSETPLPEAWIAGRRHRLVPHVGSQETTCSECNRNVASLYTPAG